MKSAFDKLIGRFNTTKERIIELEDKSVEITQTEVQRELFDMRLRSFIISSPIYHEMLKEILQEKKYQTETWLYIQKN